MVLDGKTNTVRGDEEIDIPAPPGAALPNTTPAECAQPPVAQPPNSTHETENGLPAYLAFDAETGYLWVANTGEVPTRMRLKPAARSRAGSRSTTRRRSGG